MPLYPVNFQVLSPQQANPFGFGLQQGAQTMGAMQDARMKAAQAGLLNAQLPYAGQMQQADLGLKQAQVPYMQSQTAMNQASLPYMGYKFMAPMLMAQARMLQAGVQNANSFKGLSETAPGAAVLQANPDMANAYLKAMQNSAGMINSGLPMQMPQPGMPNSPASYSQLPGAQTGMQGTPITPQQINQLRQLMQPGIPSMQPGAPDALSAIQNASGLLAQHKTTDASARQKNLYASNIEKTLGQINPDDLTQYAGVGGTAERFAQKGLASMGAESNNYDNYTKSLNAANLLATQARQFYGDSIQPSMIQRLEGLTNPSTWANNPKLAKDLFNQTKQILSMETGTYRQAMQSTAPYKSQTSMQSQSMPMQARPSMSKVINGATYHKINGQWYAQ